MSLRTDLVVRGFFGFFFHILDDLQMKEDDGLDVKLQGTFISCVVAV